MPKNRFRYHKANIIKKPKQLHSEGKRNRWLGVFSWFKLNILLIIIIILALAALIIYSPIFWIDKNKIKYTNKTSFDTTSIDNAIADQIDNYYLYILPRKNILFFDTSLVESAFSDHPYIDNLSINKKPLHTLEVSYELRDPEFVVTNNTDFFLVDILGYVLAKLDTTNDYNYLPKLVDTVASYNVGDKVNYQYFLPTIQSIWQQVNNKIDNLTVANISLNTSNAELKVFTNEGWFILFNLEDDVDHQIRVLDQVLKDNITDRTQLQYIDLRVSDWVYYK